MNDDSYKERSFFSVVLPVKDRPDGLITTLRNFLNKNVEIVVINDGSSPEVTEVVNRFKENLCIKEIKLEKVMGPAFARNVGVRETTSDWILFIDDCIKVTIDWDLILRNYLDDNDYIATPVDLEPEQKESSLKTVFRLRLFPYFGGESKFYGPTAFLLVKRKVFDSIGGFKLTTPGGSDYLFGYEVNKKNFKMLCLNEGIKVWHTPKSVKHCIKDYYKLQASKLNINIYYLAKDEKSFWGGFWSLFKEIYIFNRRLLCMKNSKLLHNNYKYITFNNSKYIGYIQYVLISYLVKSFVVVKVKMLK